MQEVPNLQDFIETIKNFCLEILGLDSEGCKVQLSDSLAMTTKGEYDKLEQVITINGKGRFSVADVFCSVCHECRHHYQYTYESFFRNCKSEATIGIDTYEYMFWIYENDEKEYWLLPREIDADVFSNLITQRFYPKYSGYDRIPDENVRVLRIKSLNESMDYLARWLKENCSRIDYFIAKYEITDLLYSLQKYYIDNGIFVKINN